MDRIRTWIAFVFVIIVITPVAYLSVFSTFHSYDDEGYILITLRDYLSGHPLLTPNRPLYGPFFYEAFGALFKLLGIVPTNDSGRFVTLAVWVLASVLGGLVAYRLTRSLWLGLTAQLVTFILLTALTLEPMTVYGAISLLLLALVACATWVPSHPRASSVLIGVVVGALCLVKINVGAFAAVAVLFAWAAGLSPPWRRMVLPLTAVFVTAAPLVLMAALLNHDWVLEFALLASLSTAALGAASLQIARTVSATPRAGLLLAGGAAVVVLTLAIAFAGGSRLDDAWNDLVVRAIRFPLVFTWPLRISAVADVWAILALGLALAGGRLSVSSTVANLGRVAAGLFTLVSVLLLPSSLFLLGLPLAWVAVKPPRGEAVDYSRVLIAALAVLESLQLYPVAGAQLALAALLMVPLGALVLNDGIAGLTSNVADRSRAARLARNAAPAALTAAVAALILNGFLAMDQFQSASPSGLQGAESVRLPAQQGAALRALTAAIEGSCSSFLTFPGMNSLYVWTGQQPPTDLRYGVWWLTPDASDQQSIVEQLDGRSGLCVVKNQALIDFWAQGRTVPSQPLVDFIDQNFVEAGTFGDYQLLVRR
jgi:hypothetical protein